MDDFLLRYDHNIIDHLGLKLYQNRPTRVIAELISNSWDADANTVHVNSRMDGEPRWVAVLDNGSGMSRVALQGSYLVIGAPKRRDPSDTSGLGRPLMGRKGIGKLATFGVAKQMDLVTAHGSPESRTFFWLRFVLSDMLSAGEGKGIYKPQIVFQGSDASQLPLTDDSTGQVKSWVSMIGDGSGTLVLMTHLSIKKALTDQGLIESLGKRFTVSLRDDFNILVNGVLVAQGNSVPTVEFRIPEEGSVTTQVGGRDVRHWIGFVKRADWSQDEAGVGVYAHGKIAQDRPFNFGVKGKEVFARYMYGVIEADWLDELPVDLVSTDRTNIDWSTDETADLHAFGQRLVRESIAKFEAWRIGQEQSENEQRLDAEIKQGAPNVRPEERRQIIDLLSEITPTLGKDEAAKSRAARALAEAWVQKPMQKLVRDLWDGVGDAEGMPPEAFTKVVEQLSRSNVPESLSLSIVFAQRAFALTRLHDYVHHGNETQLQSLIERFPWIVEPDVAVLTADKSLKRAVEEAEKRGQIPTGRRLNSVSEQNRPDFVFLSSPNHTKITVIELKNPQLDLTIDNRQQLSDYLVWFEAHYPDAELQGYLIGRNPNNMEPKHVDIRIIPWTDVLIRSRNRNLELLAAMLIKSGDHAAGDTRAAAAIDLGGKEAEELLTRFATENDELKTLMESLPKSGVPGKPDA